MSGADALPSSSREPRGAVFIGAGHAHLESLKHAADFTSRGFELTVIAPENFWYSGLATGVLGGHYAPEEDQVDVAALVANGGERARFIRDRVTAITPHSRTVRLSSGETLGYDVLSLNLGSETRPIPGEDDRVFPIKPLRSLWRLRQTLEAERAAGKASRVVVAGGGASGCEIAANVRALIGSGATVSILARGQEIVSSLAPSARRRLLRFLGSRGIAVHCKSAVDHIDGNAVVTPGGDRHRFDYLVNATGLFAPPLLAETGLPVNERGELIVDEFLRSTSDGRIFGGGDCVQLRGRELARIGVYAVREAPVLRHNLLATLEGRALRRFKPQRYFLLILNLGDGVGLALWRGFYWFGRSAFWLKDRLDRAFLARFQKPT